MNTFDGWRHFNRNQLEVLIEKLMVGIVVHDLTTKIIFANQSASELLGLSFNQLIGVDAADPNWKFINENGEVLPLDDYPVNRVLRDKKSFHDVVIGVYRPDKPHPTWALVSGFGLFNLEGDIQQVVINFSDITVTKELTTKVDELQNLLRAALDQSPFGIIITDAPSGKVRYINHLAKEINLLKTDSLTLDRFVIETTFFHFDGTPLGAEELPVFLALKFNKSFSGEFLVKKQNHDDQFLWSTASPVLNHDGKTIAIIAITLDTTKRHLLEGELKNAKDIAEASLVAKSRFLDIAAHELRTPVTSFSLGLQLALKQVQRGVTINLAALQKLNYQAQRISRLVVDLLDVSRLEHNGINLHKSSHNLSALTKECIDDFTLRTPDRDVQFFDSPDSPLILEFDSDRIYQVISNYLDNAFKYTPAQTPVEVRLESTSQTIRLSVKDHGPGIAPLQLSHLFNPFSRGSTELSQHSGGLGLGLYICKRLIELHGGKVWVDTQLGQGSTFFFEIPRNTS